MNLSKFTKWLRIDEKNKNVILTDLGVDKIEKLALQKNILKNNNFYDPANLDLVHHTNQALKANLIFKKDTDYIINNGKVQIIDEFTGRILGGRRFSDGLHQAINERECGNTRRKSNFGVNYISKLF